MEDFVEFLISDIYSYGPKSRENLSSGFATSWDSNQPAQLQKLYYLSSEKQRHPSDCFFIWACARQNQQNDLCGQRRFGWAWAFAQSDQSSLSTQRSLMSLAILRGHSEYSDQTEQMCSFGFVMLSFYPQGCHCWLFTSSSLCYVYLLYLYNSNSGTINRKGLSSCCRHIFLSSKVSYLPL